MTEYVLIVRTQILYFCLKFATTMYSVLLEYLENMHTRGLPGAGPGAGPGAAPEAPAEI